MVQHTAFPKSRTELINLIEDAVEKNGPNCDLNFIDTSAIVDMSWLFSTSMLAKNVFDISCQHGSKKATAGDNAYALMFNGDISGWNVSNVIDMTGMFFKSPFNGRLDSWNVKPDIDTIAMFYGSKFKGDTSHWGSQPS